MRNNSLTNWFYTTNQIIPKDEDIKPTHLLLDGGRVSIKKELLDTFYKLYAKCLEEKVPLHIVEHKTNIFRFFCDLDFTDKILLGEEYILRVVNLIQESIHYIYEENYKVIVCTTESKKIIKNENEYIKQGLHLHWPSLYVNKENSILIRNLIIHKLKSTLGEREDYNIWDDVVDLCIYKNNGIRMVGSSKCSYDRSGTNQLIDEKRVYLPAYVIDCFNNKDEEELKSMLDDKYRMVKMTSIQDHDNSLTEIKKYPEALKQNLECEECDEEKPMSMRLLPSDIKYKEIIRFFRIHVKNYEADDIKKVLNFDGKVYVILTKSKFCQNIGRAHNSCQIYFKLTRDGLVQKCHCICNTLEGRKYGYCKDYSSEFIQCTDHLLKLLNWKNRDTTKGELPTIGEFSSEKTQIEDFRSLLYNRFTNKSPPKQRNRKKSNSKSTS
jgi:hypothetical protein